MERNERLTLLIGIGVLVLVVLGYYFLLLSPLREDYNEAVAERQSKEGQRADLQSQVAALEAIRLRAPEIERQLLELSKRVPSQGEIPSLLVQIEEVANAAGITQIAIQPGSPEPPPGGGDFQRIPVTMSFEGTYVQMQEFLRRVESLARLMSVNEVTYEVLEAEGEGTTTAQPGAGRLVQVEISAEVYVQPSGVPVGPSPLQPPPLPDPGVSEETTGGTTGA